MFLYLYYNDIRVGIEPSRPSPEPARASLAKSHLRSLGS